MADPITNVIAAGAESYIAGKVKDHIINQLTKRARMDLDVAPSNKEHRNSDGVTHHATQPVHSSIDITVTYTTDLLLKELGANKGYFIPMGIYDWWLTKPTNDQAKNYYTYSHIDGFKQLPFYTDKSPRDARYDYNHYVQPIEGHVEIKDWLFYTDTLEGTDKKQVTFGSEQAFINFGKTTTSGFNKVDLKWESADYPSAIMFAKQTLPKCAVNMTILNELGDRTSIRTRAALKLTHYFNTPLPSSVRFVKPVLNAYSEANQGANMNFTWMPFENSYIKTTTTAQGQVDCATYGYSFTGLYLNGFPPSHAPRTAYESGLLLMVSTFEAAQRHLPEIPRNGHNDDYSEI